VFRIKAEYSEQVEVKTTLDRAREFFGEMRNFVDLMPGIEAITNEANGIKRWLVRAEVPVLGPMRAGFAVELTEDLPHRIEWSPAHSESKNYLRYAAIFEECGGAVLVRIVQRVEMRRKHAKELHLMAGLIGENRISAEMEKRVGEMIRTFIQRARTKLEA
jgi:hypothetical protein